MKYLLDTDMCIYMIKRKPPQVLRRFETFSVGEIGISAITAAELQYGVQKSQYVAQNQKALQQFLAPLVIVDFDEQAASAYGKIRARLEEKGKPIGAMDTLIAAQAVSMEATLVTNNEREFARIPELALINWVTK
jgi:tRNA(fMet)-specific endonuclease VapC